MQVDFYVDRGVIFDGVDRLESAQKYKDDPAPLEHVGRQLMKQGYHGFVNDW
jgi:hypothetical protein